MLNTIELDYLTVRKHATEKARPYFHKQETPYALPTKVGIIFDYEDGNQTPVALAFKLKNNELITIDLGDLAEVE